MAEMRGAEGGIQDKYTKSAGDKNGELGREKKRIRKRTDMGNM